MGFMLVRRLTPPKTDNSEETRRCSVNKHGTFAFTPSERFVESPPVALVGSQSITCGAFVFFEFCFAD